MLKKRKSVKEELTVSSKSSRVQKKSSQSFLQPAATQQPPNNFGISSRLLGTEREGERGEERGK